MNEKDFDIILSKNRLAREIRDIYNELNKTERGWKIPDHVKFDFDEIEKKTGTGNQPTGREILNNPAMRL